MAWRKERLALAAQAGGELAVDEHQRAHDGDLRIGRHRDRLAHDVHAQIGDVLADLLRQRIVVGHPRAEKDHPELAIVEESPIEIGSILIPAVDDRLQSRRRLEEKVRLQLTRTCDLLRDRPVSLGLLRYQEALPRTRSVSWRP